MNKVIRLQIEIEQEQMAELERFQELGGLRTKKDLLNNALTLLKWAARERGQGNAIVSLNEREQVRKELEMPFLETYASNVAHLASTSPHVAVRSTHVAARQGHFARNVARPRPHKQSNL